MQPRLHPIILFLSLLPLTIWAWLPEVPIYLFQYAGRDPHWKLTLYYALEKGLVFGKDIAFTYGPLGFLETRLGYPGFINYQLIFDATLLALFFRAVFSMTKAADSWLAFFLVVISLVACGFYPGASQSTVLLFSLELLYLQLFLYRWSFVDLTLAGLIAIFLFFAKFGLGILGVGLFIIALVLGCYCSGRLKAGGVALLLWLIAFFGLSYALPIDLAGYLQTGFSFILGYSEAMALKPKGYLYQNLALALVVLSGIFLLLRHESSNGFFQKLLIPLGVFALFKQGFVRADVHMFWFMQFVPVVCMGVMVYWKSRVSKLLFILALVCQITPLTNFELERVFGQKRTSLQMYNIVRKDGLIQPFNAFSTRSKLPKSFSEVITDSSVDIFRYASADLILAKKNYQPRPVFQTYAAYMPELDALNAKYFSLDSASEYVVYEFHSTDGRYSFAQEVQTKLELIKNYKIVLKHKEKLLLKRRSERVEFVQRELEPSFHSLEEEVSLPREGLVLLKADVRLSFLGKLAKFLLRAPELELQFSFEDGSKENFRVTSQQLRAGIIASPYIGDAGGADSFFSNQLSKLKPVSSFSLKTSGFFPHAGRFKVQTTSLEAPRPQ